MKNLVVTGSVAYDYLMSFPGKFTEHFLPEHMKRVSLSFLVDTMDKRRGGCAPNIAYTLALLGDAAAVDGHCRGGLRRLSTVARRRRCRYVAREADPRQVLRVVLLQHRYRKQPDRVVLHRRHGRRRPVVVPQRAGLWPRDHRAERSRRDGAVRRGVPHARHSVHLRPRAAVRANGRRPAARRRHRRDSRDRE